MFILSEQRDAEPLGSAQLYDDYLKRNRSRFPAGGYALASSDWYFDFTNPRCPHDARLEQFNLVETAQGPDEPRRCSISLRLRGAYGGILQFKYDHVVFLQVAATDLTRGHRDWRYDEFRLDEDGRLVHEIEWWGPRETARWVIVATDVELSGDTET